MGVQKRLKNSVSLTGPERVAVRCGNPTVEPYLFQKLIIQQTVAQIDFMFRQAQHERRNHMISTYHRSP